MRIEDDGTIILTIGFSPCPNDTYIFDALVNGKINSSGFHFEPVLEDVEQLNRRALRGELDITKLSFRAYADCASDYILCDSGSALGFGVGPLLVRSVGDEFEMNSEKSVAIPGEHTTANFLFRLFYPQVSRRQELLFSDIEDAVCSGKVDAGVIIHENRFTYAAKGLKKIADLGQLWEEETGQPIPLGGIVAKRTLPLSILRRVNSLIRESLYYANENPNGTENYVAQHAQSMDPAVRKQHIELYVNEYSVDLEEKGRSAVRYFYDKGFQVGILANPMPDQLFISELNN